MNQELVTFQPKGEINPPSSKSYCHRYLIGAFIANKPFKINNFNFCADTIATLEGLKALGGDFATTDNSVSFLKREITNKQIIIDAKESASTLRMLLPIACYLYEDVTFIGSEKLFSRPLNVYEDILNEYKIPFVKTKTSINIKKKLVENKFSIRGDVSSQFVTGLLFYSLLSKDDVALDITTPLKSSGYVSMTFDVMNEFGNSCKINENQEFELDRHKQLVNEVTIETDYSSSSYFAVLGAIKGGIKINNLNNDSDQPDRILLKLLTSIGAQITNDNNCISFGKSMLKPFKIDISNCIDLGPTLFVLASLIEGKSMITGVDRLVIKESNRLEAMIEELKKASISISLEDNKVIIEGKNNNIGNYTFNSHNDHRIAMALAIYIIASDSQGTIINSECVNKSYSNFFKDLLSLKQWK